MELRFLKILVGHRLSTRIIGILLAFFLVALGSVGLTLYWSWQLEGVAAAINDGGSLRMRSWKIAHQVSLLTLDAADRAKRLSAIAQEIGGLEGVQHGLERGDPQRPLFVPRDQGIPRAVAHLGEVWLTRIRPLAERAMAARDPLAQASAIKDFEEVTAAFVDEINAVVHRMEISYARNTTLLRSLQIMLLGLAVLGTILLLRFFLVAVIRPVRELQAGMQRMERGDLATRLEELTRDEFGDLARGFNRMAGKLENAHATLAERVESKTRSLAERNRELRILYEVSRALREPAGVEELSQRFLDRVQETFAAAAASVRLFDADEENLYLACHSGLGEQFVHQEAVLRCGDCLCDKAALGDAPVVSDTGQEADGALAVACAQAGFATVSAIPVNHNARRLGVFTLYFTQATGFSEGDRELLQTLGQHLGMAIENARLKQREREMAVSEERNLIARQLHDSIAQGLAFLNLQVQMLEQALDDGKPGDARETATLIQKGVQESYADVRELLQHFRANLAQKELSAALEAALEKFTEQSGVPGEFHVHGVGVSFGAEVETQVLYIVQEALSNIRKHAQAERVRIDLWRDRDGMRLAVDDDGVGFSPAPGEGGATGGEHIGLQIMNERALRIDGVLEIRSRPGDGTRISLAVKRKLLEQEST